MAQFDVYRNPSLVSGKRAPLLVEVQGDISTCVVIPLVSAGEFLAVSVLNPTFEIAGKWYLLSTAEMSSVPRSRLGRPFGSLKGQRTEIIEAIDRLLL